MVDRLPWTHTIAVAHMQLVTIVATIVTSMNLSNREVGFERAHGCEIPNSEVAACGPEAEGSVPGSCQCSDQDEYVARLSKQPACGPSTRHLNVVATSTGHGTNEAGRFARPQVRMLRIPAVLVLWAGASITLSAIRQR